VATVCNDHGAVTAAAVGTRDCCRGGRRDRPAIARDVRVMYVWR